MLDRLRSFYSRLSPWTRDTLERALSTAAQTFVASVPLSAAVTSLSEKDWGALSAMLLSAGSAAVAAALSFLKARIAKHVGHPDSASLDPRI